MVLHRLLSTFLENPCLLCTRSAKDPLCDFCQRKVQQCRVAEPSQYWQGEPPLFPWGVYDGLLKRAIAAIKYNGCQQIGNFLGCWLGKAWSESPLRAQSKLVVIPIPLHPQKLKVRGFNQAELIAHGFCEYTGYALHSKALYRVRATEAMFGLNRLQREKNLEGAFKVSQSFPRQSPPVLLMDDIYTTGTTVREAARVLRDCGIRVVGVATVSVAVQGK